MAFLKNTDFESATRQLGLEPQPETAVWLKVGITFGSPIPNYAVAQFCEKEIVIFGVTPAGTIDMDAVAVIPLTSDADVSVARRLNGYKMTVDSEHGTGQFVIRKFMIGAGWHKVSVANVLSRFEKAS